ncbi:MAG: hypothetical protein NUV49_02590 [Patescibacteria group bacterium]|nr:hypothetical protein [Patescibacteria group bacterium]
MSWASKRKFLYSLLVLIFISVVIAIPTYSALNKAPTCVDNKQNGEEIGVDCGGPCDKLCPSQTSELIVHWSRGFRVADGIYDVVAYVENVNTKAGIESIIYKFKLYDENNILIEEKLGKTYVGPNEQFAVFESGIRTGQRIPKRVFFEFKPDPEWKRIEIPLDEIVHISIRNQQITDAVTKPRLKALLVNDKPLPVSNIEVVAILYDIEDNAIAVSATHVDGIDKNGTQQVSFTWQEPFGVNPVRISVIPRVNFFESHK